MILTCAATLCFSPSLQVGTVSYFSQQPVVAWTETIPIGPLIGQHNIHTTLLPSSWLPTSDEQKVMKKALLRSIQIINEGARAN